MKYTIPDLLVESTRKVSLSKNLEVWFALGAICYFVGGVLYSIYFLKPL